MRLCLQAAAFRAREMGAQFVLLGSGGQEGALKRLAETEFKDHPDVRWAGVQAWGVRGSVVPSPCREREAAPISQESGGAVGQRAPGAPAHIVPWRSKGPMLRMNG